MNILYFEKSENSEEVPKQSVRQVVSNLFSSLQNDKYEYFFI